MFLLIYFCDLLYGIFVIQNGYTGFQDPWRQNFNGTLIEYQADSSFYTRQL